VNRLKTLYLFLFSYPSPPAGPTWRNIKAPRAPFLESSRRLAAGRLPRPPGLQATAVSGSKSIAAFYRLREDRANLGAKTLERYANSCGDGGRDGLRLRGIGGAQDR
jgi:hypothetical protein